MPDQLSYPLRYKTHRAWTNRMPTVGYLQPEFVEPVRPADEFVEPCIDTVAPVAPGSAMLLCQFLGAPQFREQDVVEQRCPLGDEGEVVRMIQERSMVCTEVGNTRVIPRLRYLDGHGLCQQIG